MKSQGDVLEKCHIKSCFWTIYLVVFLLLYFSCSGTHLGTWSWPRRRTRTSRWWQHSRLAPLYRHRHTNSMRKTKRRCHNFFLQDSPLYSGWEGGQSPKRKNHAKSTSRCGAPAREWWRGDSHHNLLKERKAHRELRWRSRRWTWPGRRRTGLIFFEGFQNLDWPDF